MELRAPDVVKTELLEGMVQYMEEMIDDGDYPGYDQEDVDTLAGLLDQYQVQVGALATGQTEAVMAQIQQLVEQIDSLNESNDGMIETEQRELLCEFILAVAADRGVGDGSDDLTEEWREW